MSESWRFYKQFCKSYRYHRWPTCEGESYKLKQWTEEMTKILDKTARGLGFERRRTELRRIDFNWYKGDSDTPILSIEHENGYRRIWNEEIPKLLASKANLKVLICYPPEEERMKIRNRLLRLLIKESEEGRFKEEFLLILGKYKDHLVNDPKQYVAFRYALGIAVGRLRTPST